jgi:SAM-dependent methyltransferase
MREGDPSYSAPQGIRTVLKAKRDDFLEQVQPELGAGGFAAHDGTIEFYGRIRSLLKPGMFVVDFGAGRGGWAHDDQCEYRKRVRDLRDTGIRLVGCDVDPAIARNPVLEQKVVIQSGASLPYADRSVDLLLADYVLEHLSDPDWFAKEIDRVLRTGGWLCARTPPKWHYVVLASKLPRVLHSSLIGLSQPERKSEDVFEAYYRLNAITAIKKHFPASRFHNCTYYYVNSPAYHFNRKWVFRIMSLAHSILPTAMHGNLFIFLRKKGGGDPAD